MVIMGMMAIHILYWIGLAKVKMFGAYRGNLAIEGLPVYMFGENEVTTLKVGQAFFEGLGVIGWAMFASIIGSLIYLMISSICKLGHEKLKEQETKQ